MLRRWMAYWFKKKGWIFTGQLPKRQKQSIMVAGPHTSTDDFKVAQGISALTGFETHLLVDRSVFRGWRKSVLKRFDVIPYDKDDVAGMRKLIEDRYRQEEVCSFVFTPMRSGEKSGEWDELFYDLSLDLEIPIVLIGIDNLRKRVKFHSHFNPSIDRERDIGFVKRFFNSFPQHS